MEEKRAVRAAVRASRAARASGVGDAGGVGGAGRVGGAGDASTGGASGTALGTSEAAALTEYLAQLTRELGANRVASFVSVNGEPETSGFLSWSLANGVEVLLPRVLPDGRLEWAVHAAGAFAPGAYGIPEPTGPAIPDGTAGCDLFLIPAAAVDRTGTRLGWGKGYFDRELARSGDASRESGPAVFAVVFEDEIFDELPAEAHDVPVHGAVTEERIHRFG